VDLGGPHFERPWCVKVVSKYVLMTGKTYFADCRLSIVATVRSGLRTQGPSSVKKILTTTELIAIHHKQMFRLVLY